MTTNLWEHETKWKLAKFMNNYLTSVSPTLLTVLPVLKSTERFDSFKKIIDSAVDGVLSAPGVAESLKVKYVNDNKTRVMRGITMRKYDGGPAILECYVFWDWNYNSWHVFVEAPGENFWMKSENN